MKYCPTLLILVSALLGCSSSDPPPPAEESLATDTASEAPVEKAKPKADPIELEPLPDPEGTDGAFTISQVMQLAHENRLYRQLFKQPVQPEVAERLTLLYSSLPLNDPPKGEEEGWQKRSNALVSAAKKVIDGDEDGPGAFKKAVNCNSCHGRHRP